MNAERWKQIDELFDAALDLPETERARFIAENTNGDEELKIEVLSLLRAQGENGSFLDSSAMRIAARQLAEETRVLTSAELINKTIGTYKIEKMLGSGGMGEVYLAYDSKLERPVALKILPSEFVADEERLKRFRREARAISALNHPYIVTVYDVGMEDGINYIATEYVEGETVRELINRGADLKLTLSVITQTCEALAAAHAAGIIHRDIKPENIMLRPDGFVKVLDFGLAKLVNPKEFQQSLTNYTMKGVIIGTPAYMSPQQLSDERVDQRTDLWSVGVVLYEMLTGKNPFKGESRQETFQKILSSEPVIISELKPDLPLELNAILKKALEKDADMSYQTASDLRADVKRLRREIDSSASLQNSISAINNPRRKIVLPLFVILLLISSGFGVWFLIDHFKMLNSGGDVDWLHAKQAQLTSFSGIKSYPSLSPDGKTFIYTIQNGVRTNIFSQRIGGKNTIDLTADSDFDSSMGTFSPNGKTIAFRSERDSGGIYLMEETGENVRRLTAFGFHPSWSPDGKQIVISDKPAHVATGHSVANSSLWTIDLETGDQKKLETKGDAIMPSWSPNGKRIAYWFVEDGKLGEIATIPAGGGEPVVIAQNTAMDWNPVWSPDSKFIFFGSDRNGNMSIWRIAVDEETGKAAGEPELIPTTALYVRHFAFSRDGKTLAYIRYETQSNLQSVAFDPKKRETVGAAKYITTGNKQISVPDLSPDGAQFVIRHPALTQEDIVIFNRDGSNWRTLTNDKFRDRFPRWSPDGQKIAFSSDRTGKYQIWMMNADGTNLRQITFSKKNGATMPIFSPDGMKLAFSEINEKKLTPFIINLSKSWQEQSPIPLPPLSDYEGSYPVRDWSSDGNKLLLLLYETENKEQGIVVFDLKTSTYEKITESGSYPVWLNDNRHIMFDNQYSLLICDTQTKQTKEIYKTPAYELQHANISHDNRMIYFRYLQVDADIWIVDASHSLETKNGN